MNSKILNFYLNETKQNPLATLLLVTDSRVPVNEVRKNVVHEANGLFSSQGCWGEKRVTHSPHRGVHSLGQ